MIRAIVFALLISVSVSTSLAAPRDCKEDRTTAQMAAVICETSKSNGPQRSAKDWIIACGQGGESTSAKVKNVGSSALGFIQSMGQTVAHPIDTVNSIRHNFSTYGPTAVNYYSGNVRQALARAAQVDAKSAARAMADGTRNIYSNVVADTASLLKSLSLVGNTFSCAPPELQQKMVCQFIGETATGYIEGAVPAAGAARAARVASAAKQMTAQARRSGDEAIVSGANARLARSAREVVIQREVDGTAIIKSVSETGREKLYLEEVVTHGKRKVRERSEIVRDAKSLAIDSNFESGAKFAQLSAKANTGGHLVSFDLNYLGKVNYFPGGTSAGNAYIKRVGEIIRSEVRNPDTTVFKNGGDELVLILPSKDPREVQRISQRVADKIFNDPQLNTMFRQARTSRAAAVPRGSRPSADQLTPLQGIANLRPSVSVGATKIRAASTAEETWEQALIRADAAGAKYKNAVRNLHGTYDGKQGLAATASTARPNPRILPPMPLPD